MLGVTLAGCGKPPPPAGAKVEAIDATQLRPAFETSKPEIQVLVDNVMMSIQGSDFAKALFNLDKLAALEELTAAQKKVVNDLTVQLRKKLDAPVTGSPQAGL